MRQGQLLCLRYFEIALKFEVGSVFQWDVADGLRISLTLNLKYGTAVVETC